MKKFGYILSGGGARGFAHLGFLKFMEEIQIKPYAISATSAGAIVGSLYAAGKSPENILKILQQNSFFGWNTFLWNKPGFFSMEILAKVLNEAIVKDNFESLGIKLFVATTDLNKGETVIYSQGKLFQAVIASASIPVVFEPVLLDEKMLVDGGLLNDFPVEPLENNCDIIIGSYVNKMEEGMTKNSSFQTFNIIERCFRLAISQAVYAKTNRCDIFIEPPLFAYDMFDIKKGEEIFEIGYQSAKKFRDQILKLAEE